MKTQRKHTVIALLEQLLPVVLAVVCVLIMAFGSYQSYMTVPCPLEFMGEYSFDGGESWQTLTDASDLSVKQGDLLTVGGGNYIFRRVEPYWYGDEKVYIWGLCVEKGVNDTWGSQS